MYEYLKSESEAGRLLDELTQDFLTNDVAGYEAPQSKGFWDGLKRMFTPSLKPATELSSGSVYAA